MMDRMIFVTGFARGGTSWLRDCIGSHPDIAILPRERTVFRDIKDPCEIRRYFEQEAGKYRNAALIVNKAPANAPYFNDAARAFPESRFIFIVRDPRDVLVSHQRGNQKWMKGTNETVSGCMRKIQRYYEGWIGAEGLPNVMLVQYENLHQNFIETMKSIYEFVGVNTGSDVIHDVYAKNTFAAQTSRPNKEDRNAAKRKGVIGDWAIHLSKRELDWYKDSEFFQEFFERHGYHWRINTYGNIVAAMHEAGVNFMTEDDLIGRRLDINRPNVVLQHDIDYLNRKWCAESVAKTASIEKELGLPALYNFLPLDDIRYGGNRKNVLELMTCIQESNPRASIGLHVNACERFFPVGAPAQEVGEAVPDEVLEYLRQQIADYRAAGITFRIATAHGYGRGRTLPNNCDTPEISEELRQQGILLFDKTIRPDFSKLASNRPAITDVGGVLKPKRLGNGYDLTDPRAYRLLPPRCFVRFLTHPGNYPVDKPSSVVMRSWT